MAGLKWRIYYDDQSSVDSEHFRPEGVPKLGVIAIVQTDVSLGRTVMQRFDNYWWHEGEWWGGDLFGLWDYLTLPGMKLVLFGRTIGTARYQSIIQQAVNDEDFTPRAGPR